MAARTGRGGTLRRAALTRLLAWTAVWTFLADQATKVLVVHWLDLLTRQEIEVLPPFIALRMAWNRGVNFGLLSSVDMRWVLVAVAVAISAFVVVWVRREEGGRPAHVAAGLLVGGAMGNVVDRILYGAGADFLNVSCCGIENPYAFNVADVSVFAGALGLVLFAGDGRPGRGAGPRRAAKPPTRSPTRSPTQPPAKTG